MQLACPGLLKAVESGATVVTPSVLFAKIVSHNVAEHQLAAGVQSWRRPAVYSIGSWLTRCAQVCRYSGRDVPVVLSIAQEHTLWQQIIEQHTPELFDVASTAMLASRAATTLAEWDVPTEHDAWAEHEDGEQFRAWLASFRTRCSEEGWVSRADLFRLVPKWMERGGCADEQAVFAGFAPLTPALSRIVFPAKREVLPVDALGSKCRAIELAQTAPTQAVPVTRCDDPAEEIELAARWARTAWERDSAVSMAVFVHQLEANRSLVERTFEQVCYPGRTVSRLTRDYGSESIFHIHASAPLREHPLIAGAMLLLQLASPRIPIGDASTILRSPWISGAVSERNARALADFKLRRSRELDVSLRDLRYASDACPRFQSMIAGVRRVVERKPGNGEFGEWSEFFNELLGTVGWPGDAELSAAEQDMVEEWKNKLSTLASLALVSTRVPVDKAIERLRLLFDEAGPGVGDFFSPVQILDLSDARGIRFDQAFITGLSEETRFWNSNVSPLIPVKLQRACGVPGASAASMEDLRAGAVADIFRTAPRLTASYSERIHPAAAKFVGEAEAEPVGWQGRMLKDSFERADLEAIEDGSGPGYQPSGRSLGGVGVIKDQSQCPFRAYAIRRLNARSLEEGCFGIDQRDRGGFLHEALRRVWDELKTRDRLRTYPRLKLQFLVEEAVRAAIQTKNEGPLVEQLSMAEVDRLIEVVLQWLSYEGERKQSFTVEATERQDVLDVAGLHLDIRIDRVDRLANGKRLLIDYKSGETKASSLEGDRPREPQLLVYAAAMREEIAGFFLAQLKPRNPKLNGFSQDLHIEAKKTQVKEWDRFLDGRMRVVESLAQSFAAGEAAVDPIRDACNFCGLAAFCRVNEARNARNGEDADE